MTLLARWREPAPTKLNDVAVYDRAEAWWSDDDPAFAPLRAMARPRLSFFERHGVKLAGARVLDVGAGGGFLSVELAARGATVVALDLAPRALQAARDEARRRGLEALAAIAAGAELLPLADASFDLVVCADVLPHIVDKSPVLDELARVVRPGGKLFVATMNRNALARFILITLGEDVLGVIARGTHAAETFIKPEELALELKARGLELAVVEGVGPVGLDRRGFTFGKLPTAAVMYQVLFTK